MPGPGFSLAIAPIQVGSGLDPIGLKDLKNAGDVLSDATKADWISRIEQSGGQSGTLNAGVSALSLSAGRIGLQLSTIVSANLNLAPSIMELALYGNAGRTGSAADLSLSGSRASAFAVSTAGLSLGIPLPAATGSMAVGATLKYSVGHAVAVAEDQGGSVTSNPLAVDVNLPMITPDTGNFKLNNGSGVGLDVGFQMKRGGLALGAAITNVFNSFAWKTDNLVYRPGTATLRQGSDSTNFDAQAYASAPSSLQDEVSAMKFKPTISVGAALDLASSLTVSADFRTHGSGGMSIDPKMHLGAGLEYRGLKVLYLRAGAAIITDGYQYGGGASLVLGPLDISAAGALEGGNLGQAGLAQFTLSFGGN
jgi:Family of unknown function (DUF5723)